MAFDGNEGEFISLADARDWTANYRTDNPGETKGHFFGKNKIIEILNQSGCKGIRAYYATDENDAKQLIFVGVDASGEDLLSDGKILDRSWPCPNSCATLSPLNS